jgi:prepilin-type processing-associated H-X9-DG protein
MTELTIEQKQLLFDYCIVISTEQEATEAEQLISSNPQAARLVEQIKATLSPLNSLQEEPCPQELEEITISRLKDTARSSRLRLEQLIAEEQARQVAEPRAFWRNFARVLSTAAVILLVAGIYFSPLQYARNKANCQSQLYRIGQAMSSYQNDNDGQLPLVAAVDGAPWWKVGFKSKSPEHQSNTRHLWLLVKEGYVENPADFLCPGKKHSKKIVYDMTRAVRYYDFPSRNHINYSFRIRCHKAPAQTNLSQKAVLSDLNPLFENLPVDFEQFTLELNKELKNLNSINHRRRGQNILFCDGHVEFVKTRFVGVDKDDIFTLQNILSYSGCETPSCETDAFLAP